MKDPVLLAEIHRGKHIESLHYGHALLYGASGLLQSWGDENFRCFTRSLIKIIQAKVCLDLIDQDLSIEELAIIGSSHRAQDIHLHAIEKLIKRFDLNPDLLQCGFHPHKQDSQLKHYCSAKHLIMLATCKQYNWDQENYLDIKHPLQVKITEELRRLNPEFQNIHEKDGCSLPSFYMSIQDMAKIFFNILGQSRYQKLIQAANSFPELIAAAGNFDTELMKAYPQRFYAKGGAEGLLLMIHLERQEVLIVKVLDGSDRPKNLIKDRFLDELKWRGEYHLS